LNITLVSVVDIDYGAGISLIGTGDDHHPLDKVGFVVVLELDISSLETMQCVLHNRYSSLHNQLPRINLALSLLDL